MSSPPVDGTQRRAKSDTSSFTLRRTLLSLILRCFAILRVLLLVPGASSCQQNKSATCLLSLLIAVFRCQVFAQWLNLADQHVGVCSLQTASSTVYQEILKQFFCILNQVRAKSEFSSCHSRIAYPSLTVQKFKQLMFFTK